MLVSNILFFVQITYSNKTAATTEMRARPIETVAASLLAGALVAPLTPVVVGALATVGLPDEVVGVPALVGGRVNGTVATVGIGSAVGTTAKIDGLELDLCDLKVNVPEPRAMKKVISFC